MFTSGCTSKVLEINSDHLFVTDGKVMRRSGWPVKVEQWRELIDSMAEEYDVPPSFVAGVMAGESGGNPNALSPAGACGLMQLMPQYFGGNKDGRLFDPKLNTRLGTKNLRRLLDKYEGNFIRALAGYNAGSARCSTKDKDWGLVQDTGYVNKCLSFSNEATLRGFSPVYPSEAGPDTIRPFQPVGLREASSGGTWGVLGFGLVAGFSYWLARRNRWF